ncbi:MAG: hypothetical protein LBV33_06095, partial [Lachnospiraceae bacterium]|nr:hypothetical protein [Lachnospiraceae bacterium]
MKKRKRILSLIYALIFLLSASWSALPVSAVDYDNLTVTDPIDVIFSLQTELLPPPNGSTANFEVQKDIIAKAADLIFDKYINAKIRVILNGSDSQADFLETSYYSSYFDQTTRNELPERLDSVVCTYFDQYSGKPRTNRGAVYDLILDNATLFKSNDTYVYYFLNAWSSVGNGYPDQFSLCNLDSMVYSEIAHA